MVDRAVSGDGESTGGSAAPGYYEFERPEVIALIPPGARSVLEFGCASGACGARIKRERGATVVGIEYLPEPARIAATRLDRVIVGDAESLDYPSLFSAGQFDAILFADVLEHLRDPEALLRRVLPLLSEDGVVIASIPNVRNAAVLQMLASGDWTYQEAGLMDRTHIHFFTRREIQRAFGRAGYRIGAMQYVFDQNQPIWANAGRPTTVNLGPVTITTPTPEDAEELFVYQFLTRAERMPPPPFAGRPRRLVSIVIPARGQFELTRACIESIRRNTPRPHEIILVDNGSTDDTAAWARAQSDVLHLRNESNRGFAAACNQGLAAAAGAFAILLNNDTVVPPGWLDPLLAPMVRDREIGLTGPRSNWVFSVQLCREARYGNDMAEMARFAADWRLRHQGTGFEVAKLVGFCLAIRREVLDAIGGLDERFGIGNFEDDDYCIRAMLAGFRCWVANDAYVHHWGSQTFKAEKVDFQAIMGENWRHFAQKWGLAVDIDPAQGFSLEPALTREFDPAIHHIPLRSTA